MVTTSLKRRALMGAVLLGLSSLTLAGCGQKSSEEHMLAARQFVDAKDPQSAIIEYKSAIQKAPKDPAPRFELGRIYLTQNNFEAAEKELNRSLDLGYRASEVLPLLTRAYQQTNAQTALAAVDHKADGLTAVKQAEVAYYKLEALLRLEQNDEARDLLNDIAAIDTSSAYKDLSLAIGKVLDDDYEGALAEVTALQARAPLNKDVLMQQACLNIFLQHVDAAIESYQAYIKVAPEDIETRFILSAILMDAKRFDDAEPLVDNLLSLSAKNPILNQYKGIIEVRKNSYSNALKHLELAIQNGQQDPLARMLAGFSAYQLGDFDKATQHLSMIASALPPSHPALRMLADSLLQLGKSEEASDVLGRLDGNAEQDVMLFSKAGFQLLQSGNVVDAKAMVDKSVPIATSAEDLTRIGILQLSLNDADGLVNLEAAVAQAPELTASQQTLANAYITTGQYDKALEIANNWQQTEPDNTMPWLLKARVYMGQQKLTDAEAAIASAEAIDSQDVKSQLLRVSLAMLQQQPEQALDAVHAALNIEPVNRSALALLFLVNKELGQTDTAKTEISQISKTHPNDDFPKVLLARIYLDEQKSEQGLAQLASIKVNDETSNLFWDTKGRLLLMAGDITSAKNHYEQWSGNQPNNKIAVLGMATILDLQNKFDAGVTLTSQFLEKRPDRQITIINAYFHAMLRQIPETEAALASLTEQERQIPYVRGIRARLQLYNRDVKEAIPNAEAAYQALPNARNLILIVAAYEMSGDADKAFNTIRTFLQTNPNNAHAKLLLAERLLSRDQTEAVTVYREVVALQPDNALALNNLAYLEHQQGMTDAAEKHARQAYNVAPKVAEIADTLGQILTDTNKLAEAKSVYDAVMTEPVSSEEIYLNYVELLLKMDMATLAKRRLSEREFADEASKTRINQLQQRYGF